MNYPVESNSTPATQKGLRRCAAFSLVEVVVAMMITAIAVTAFYASAGQALRIMKSGKETVVASQLLQERVEALRSASQWKSVATPAGLSGIVASAAQSAANLKGATETFTVTSYPTAGTAIVVTRSPSGTVATSGSDLSSQFCVKLTAKVNWTGIGNVARSRQVNTIVTKGGL